MHRCRTLVLVGSLGLITGACLPWSHWGCPTIGSSVHLFGLDGESAASGAIGLLLLVMALAKKPSACSHYSLLGTLLASCATGIALDSLVRISADISAVMADSPTDVVATVGIGLFITLAGAIVSLGGALLPVRTQQTVG